MQLKWSWYKLDSVDLAHEHFNNMKGVYIICHGGQNHNVVYVGQGNIRDRLAERQRDQRIQGYAYLGLYATWAEVNEQGNRYGIEAYLASRCSPIVGETHPLVNHIEVNLPWD